MKIYFAADHAGFEMKSELVNFARGELGHEVEDCGAVEMDPTDNYPSIIGAAAGKLASDAKAGVNSRAIVIGASGQGEAMAANRFRGVRCALYYGPAHLSQTDSAGEVLDILTSSRAHNDANALSLGARFITVEEAKAAVRAWLTAPVSSDERHLRRIRELDDLG